jgi:hypothetical protein
VALEDAAGRIANGEQRTHFGEKGRAEMIRSLPPE